MHMLDQIGIALACHELAGAGDPELEASHANCAVGSKRTLAAAVA